MKNTQNMSNNDASQITRMNAAQREALVALYGIENMMQGYQKQFHSLCARVPNGWRDYRLSLMTISKLISRILRTVPEEQLRTMETRWLSPR